MDGTMSLLDTVWPHVSRFLPKYRPSPRGGRPPADNRLCLGGILWVLTTGARWRDIPSPYPSSTTCWRRMRDWTGEQIWPKVWRRILRILKQRGDLPTDEVFLDASFVAAKKGGFDVGKTKCGKGMKIELVVNRNGTPLAETVAAANEAETALAEPVLNEVLAPRKRPTPVIGDKGYDSDPLRHRLRKRHWLLISPHRRNRRRKPTVDGRRQRRYRRRYIVERTNAWMDHFHRVVVRWEFYSYLFEGFVTLACIVIALWRF